MKPKLECSFESPKNQIFCATWSDPIRIHSGLKIKNTVMHCAFCTVIKIFSYHQLLYKKYKEGQCWWQRIVSCWTCPSFKFPSRCRSWHQTDCLARKLRFNFYFCGITSYSNNHLLKSGDDLFSENNVNCIVLADKNMSGTVQRNKFCQKVKIIWMEYQHVLSSPYKNARLSRKVNAGC